MNSSIPFQSLSSERGKEDGAPLAASFSRTLRAFAEKQQLESPRPRPVQATTTLPKAPLKALGPLRREPMGMAKATPAKVDAPPSPAEKEAPAPKRSRPQAEQWLARAWAWLQKQQRFSAKKQLRVSETVSLGEKRFVAVVQIEGQKFLIGGGSSGVALLAELETDDVLETKADLENKLDLSSAEAAQVLQPIAWARGRSR